MSENVKNKTRRCPFCAELIQARAIKCRFCAEFLVGEEHPAFKKRGFGSDDDLEQEEPEEEYEEEEIDGDENQSDEEIDDDRILYRGSPSIFASPMTYLRAGIILAVGILLYHLPLEDYVSKFSVDRFEFTDDKHVKAESYRILVSFLISVFAVIYLVFKILVWKSIGYEVSPDRIEWSRGILSRKIDNVDMFRVVDLKLHRSLIDCLLGIGTVKLYTRDKSDPEFDFFKIRKPRKLYDIIKKAAIKADLKQNVVHVE